MVQAERRGSKALLLGILALAFAAQLPALMILGMAMSAVVHPFVAIPMLLGFVAALPLGIIAWRSGAYEIRAGASEAASAASLARGSLGGNLGRAAVALWVFLVLLAALSYGGHTYGG